MSDILNFSTSRFDSQENILPPLWTPSESEPIMPNLPNYIQIPTNGFGCFGSPTTEDRNASNKPTCAPPGLGSLLEVTRETSNINMELFNPPCRAMGPDVRDTRSCYR